MMTAEEARWIRENALTPRIIATTGPLDLCACQLGPCGECSRRGRHDRCAERNSGPPHESTAGHITDPGGFVCGVISDALGHVVHASFYEVGHRHAWVCPCHRSGHDGWVAEQQALAAAEAARPTQLSLF